ncbi:MAG TPA: tail fiber domain-containing protein [Bradyrhizobium sp.]|nr:tail fiber domain-containing protein [Bradyrhizobium sp.]
MIKHKAFASTRVLALMLGATLITSGKAKADFVIADDLIVQGSACVGLDCVDGEAFGFDTIRLKENNTRIKFDDTSTSVGFPNNDWQLTANDSASGGLNKFSIENITTATVPFTIVGAAPTNSLFVDNAGRLGIKTAVPGLNIHISTSDTPAQRFEQTNAGGFTAQTWDIGANEANFFVRDLTGGSRLPFRIRPGAPTSSIDINASGNVGVGTASPGFSSAIATHILTVHGGTTRGMLELANGATDAAANTAGQVAFIATANTGVGRQVAAVLSNTAGSTAADRGGNLLMFTKADAGVLTARMQIDENGGVSLFNLTGCGAGIKSDGAGLLSCITSSRQFKNITGDLPSNVALANIMALRPQTGSYKETPDVPEHWLIAEEVAEVDPALIGLNDGKPHVVKTQNVMADLVAVVQRQVTLLETQQQRIDALERKLSAKQ